MVWIHGGAFRTGSGASPLYEGTTLAARGDVVVITINYRLGLLGFLGHPDLAADAGGPCANWGLLDCVEALRWVQAHGAAFGGDPSDVTIFGESAGAAAVALLCAMPMARGLFHKAVVQSGAPLTSRMERAVELAERATELAGVSSVDELRSLPVEQILAVQQQVEADGADRTFIPAVDGTVVPTLPGRALRDGSAAGVPMLIGSNVDEWKLWAAADPHSRDLDEDRLRSRLARFFPADALEGLIASVRDARTGRGEAAAPNDVFYAVETERTFRVPALRVADTQALHAPTFVYLFGWGSPAMRGWLGACHGLEIAFVFGNQGRGRAGRLHRRRPGGGRPRRADDGRLAGLRAHRRSVHARADVARARCGDPPHHGVRRHDPTRARPARRGAGDRRRAREPTALSVSGRPGGPPAPRRRPAP